MLAGARRGGRRRGRALLLVGAVAAVLALVAGTTLTAVVLTDDDAPAAAVGTESAPDDATAAGTAPPAPAETSPTGPAGPSLDDFSRDELDVAKAATVLLVAETTDDAGRDVRYSGSGSIISRDGLILSNAHVAQPTAPGLAEYYGDSGIDDPRYVLVALVEGSDAAPEYRARPVEVDGLKEAAVVRIYATADGDRVRRTDLDLPTMALGDSDDLESGDDVTVLGFPGISGSSRLTVTKGVISTFIDRDDLGPRSEIDTEARIAPGNSGGAAIDNDARIIGTPSALFGERNSTVVSGRIRPINLVLDLIEAAESAS